MEYDDLTANGREGSSLLLRRRYEPGRFPYADAEKKNLIPRMDRCGDRLIRDPYDRRGRWRELMPQAKGVWLELGCGKGRFTAGMAAEHPDVLYLAVEMVPDAMVVAMEKARDAALRNVWFVDGDAALLPDMFADGEIDRLYINFCDPWPKSNQKNGG